MAEIYKAAQSTALESVRDTVVGKLEAMVWTGISPDIDYVYEEHDIADMSFNAVSVGISSCLREEVGGATSPTGPVYNYMVAVVIRVHTAVAGEYNDEIKAARLLQSINNLLAENNALAAGMVITGDAGFEFGETFEDSDTVGGSLSFTVQTTSAHTQV